MANKAASGLRDFFDAFVHLGALKRAFWIVLIAYVVESMAYFGILILMTTYLTADLKIPDAYAGMFVSLFTMGVTLFTIGLGSYLEKLGVRRAMLIGFLLCVTGRALWSAAPLFSGHFVIVVIVIGLIINAAGPAITTPMSYSGAKQYTDERTNSMGYGLNYAMMNLGIVGIGVLSAWIRPAVQAVQDGAPEGTNASGFIRWLATHTGSGVQAMNWVCVGVTAVALVGFFVLFTKRVEATKLRPDERVKAPAGPKPARWQRIKNYFVEGPLGNARFVFFIFMLLPVRTLFAHQWLTMPPYILRAYDKSVADKMEWLVNVINPAIIFFGVPLVTALTRRVNIYTMMIIGTLVSAVPTFLLCFGPRLDLLLVYFVVFSIGEAMWSARFYEYASEIAPAGRIAQYMGLASIPWLLAKGTTGFYSGILLQRYCAEGAPKEQLHTGVLWFIYGCIALSTPLGLWLARKWVRAGWHTQLAAKEA